MSLLTPAEEFLQETVQDKAWNSYFRIVEIYIKKNNTKEIEIPF